MKTHQSLVIVATRPIFVIALAAGLLLSGLSGCGKSSVGAESNSDDSSGEREATAQDDDSRPDDVKQVGGGESTGRLMSFESPIGEAGRGFRSESTLTGVEPGSEPNLQPAGAGVAVIDLNRVAIGLNRLQAFDERLRLRREDLESKIQLLDDAYQTEIDDLIGPDADSPNIMQREDIVAKESERQINLNEAQRQALQEIAAFEESIKLEFMAEVRPVAFIVARDRGFGVVLTVPQVFAFAVDSHQDITTDVIDRMTVQSPSLPQSDLPNLSQPGNEE